MSETIFSKIIRREVPADIVFEDGVALAFRDTNPQAPTHVLVIPKKPIASLDEVQSEDEPILGHLMWVCRQVAAQEGLSEGYRVVVNCGPDAGQAVEHLHLHVLGGRKLRWPPG